MAVTELPTRNGVAHSSKPPLVFAAVPHWSHMEKLITLAEGLIAKGYPVTFIGGPLFKEQIESMGATFEPLDSAPTRPEAKLPDDLQAQLETMPPHAPETAFFLWTNMFLRSIPRSFRSLQRALKRIDDVRTILIHDSLCAPAAPLFRGAAGLRPHTTIAVGCAPWTVSSEDIMPYNAGKPPATGPDAREVHRAAQAEVDREGVYALMTGDIADVFNKMGAAPPGRAVDALGLMNDVWCHLTIPEFEWTRNDIKHEERFLGMTSRPGRTDRKMPAWWDEVLEAKKEGKKIIAVSRSSFDGDLENVILPALEALKDREDAVVVTALVISELDDFKKEHEIPGNAYVDKWIPMDVLLPQVSLSLIQTVWTIAKQL